jgi:hypothetical protein
MGWFWKVTGLSKGGWVAAGMEWNTSWSPRLKPDKLVDELANGRRWRRFSDSEVKKAHASFLFIDIAGSFAKKFSFCAP